MARLCLFLLVRCCQTNDWRISSCSKDSLRNNIMRMFPKPRLKNFGIGEKERREDMNFKSLLLSIVGVLAGLVLIVVAIKEVNFWLGFRGCILLVAGIALYFYCKRKK